MAGRPTSGTPTKVWRAGAPAGILAHLRRSTGQADPRLQKGHDFSATGAPIPNRIGYGKVLCAAGARERARFRARKPRSSTRRARGARLTAGLLASKKGEGFRRAMSSQPAIETICSTLNEGEERPRS